MKYNFNKTLDIPFDKAIELTTERLNKEGFGIMTEIEVATINPVASMQAIENLDLGEVAKSGHP